MGYELHRAHDSIDSRRQGLGQATHIMHQRSATSANAAARRLVRGSARVRFLASIVFDRPLKKHHRERAALSPHLSQYSYLKDEVAERLAERLEDIHESYDFPDAVDLCCGTGHMRRALHGRGGVQNLLELDSSEAMLAASAALAAAEANGNAAAAVDEDGVEDDVPLSVTQRLMDDELPPLERESCDLTVSSMALHWVNDLPGTLATARRALRPNGLFLGAMLGGETLAEMRSAFVLADLERRGGVAQRMSPMCSVADAGALMQAAGFALPTVDTEVRLASSLCPPPQRRSAQRRLMRSHSLVLIRQRVLMCKVLTVRYPDAWTLWHHLRAMGESHATLNRAYADRDTLLAAAAIYAQEYGDADGTIPASFQLIYLTGWAPHDSQQRPLPRGSAQFSLQDLNLPEGGDGGVGGGDGGDGGVKLSLDDLQRSLTGKGGKGGKA